MNSIKAAFLGPQSENMEALESLILEALRDHAYWRKNFHPEDVSFITQADKLKPEYQETMAQLRQELFKILSDLKKGVPFFSPRYLGHMNSDILIAAIAGYFSAMLYNQNNIVAESSPETIKKEIAYIQALVNMFGMPPLDPQILAGNKEGISSWGHLCSGGTTANTEAMWAARNIQYYPLAIRLYMVNNTGIIASKIKNIKIAQPNGEKKPITQMSAYELLSLNPVDILDIRLTIRKSLESHEFKAFEDELPTIRKTGTAEFYKICLDRGLLEPNYQQPKLIAPESAHYSWSKLTDILGLGEDQIIKIPLDDKFRMNIGEVRKVILDLYKQRIPIMGVISVCGTTEEGAIDRADDIVEMRKEFAKERNISYWLHSDAAYGGFFASMVSEEDKKEGRYKDITALNDMDSITIDPHKLGYVPYPAGAVLFRNARVRDHIVFNAPYLSDHEDITKAFWGKWTLEGSRPGAAAVSCYLSQHCYPLTPDGFGKIVKQCNDITQSLLNAFASVNDPEFAIYPLYDPDLNIACYVVKPKKMLKNAADLNRLTDKIAERMHVSGDYHSNFYHYVVSKTEFEYQKYKNTITLFFEKIGVVPEPGFTSLSVIRTVVMNPLTQYHTGMLENYARFLIQTAKEALPETLIHAIQQKFAQGTGQRRLKILIVEDQSQELESLKSDLEQHYDISRCFDVESAGNLTDATQKLTRYQPDVLIADLNLTNQPNNFDGMILIRNIRQTNNTLPIIVYSGYINTPKIGEQLKALNIPEDCIIAKNTEDRMNDYRKILHEILCELKV